MAAERLIPENYRILADILRKTTGMELGSDKEYLLVSRLEETWKSLGLSSLDDLAIYLRDKKDAALEKKIGDLMTTNESLFFRDATPFETFQSKLLPLVHSEKKALKNLRIWSAACSNGQEPYSIAMCMLESGLNWSEWKIQIVATDIAGHVLNRAKVGKYSTYETTRGMPLHCEISILRR